MLRLHFTPDDLARLRIAKGPDPLWETVLSANLLGTVRGRAAFDWWRARARTQLTGLPHTQRRLIRYLAPPTGDFPDFLTPSQTDPDFEAGIEAIHTTPTARLRQDLSVLHGCPTWARPLAAGEPAAVAALGHALRSYHQTVVAPYWPRIRASVDADRGRRARALLDRGSDGLLDSLRPVLRWQPPVLEADYPVSRDLHLRGRGLLLVPSVFCWRTPVTLVDPELPPVLVYPVTRATNWWTGNSQTHAETPLADLIGKTRAAALRMIEEGCTTGELARRTGITPPTASQHAGVLREAGLVLSHRHGNQVVHTLTPMGAALLTFERPAVVPSRSGMRRR